MNWSIHSSKWLSKSVIPYTEIVKLLTMESAGVYRCTTQTVVRTHMKAPNLFTMEYEGRCSPQAFN